MKVSAVVMAATFGFCAVSSTFAIAQTVPAVAPPIQVVQVRYSSDQPGEQGADYDLFVDMGLTVTFKNVSSQTANSVTFAVLDPSGFQLGEVGRHGTFAPGVLITRNFGQLKTRHKHGLPAKVRLVSVSFVDGSSWSEKK